MGSQLQMKRNSGVCGLELASPLAKHIRTLVDTGVLRMIEAKPSFFARSNFDLYPYNCNVEIT